LDVENSIIKKSSSIETYKLSYWNLVAKLFEIKFLTSSDLTVFASLFLIAFLILSLT